MAWVTDRAGRLTEPPRWYSADEATKDATKLILDAIDWQRVKKRFDDVMADVIGDLHYYVEETVARDASLNLAGHISDRARDIVHELLKGNEALAQDAMGADWQYDIRAKILEANEEVIARGALGDANKEIARLKQVIRDQNDKIVRTGIYAPHALEGE
jgi:polyhydroxyalkanoate synthesis regulator phasin